jgi:hypothetical protein
MPELTTEGRRIVKELADRHGFSMDAVQNMLIAVLNGNGQMAQFGHPEFGGSGQWMQGGMLMIGDMFNNYLKGRVQSLCGDISSIMAQQGGLIQSGSFQSQTQSGSGSHGQQQSSGSIRGESSLFVPDPDQNWWPKDLGHPSAVGNQNQIQYAYFAHARRLAVKTGSSIWVYDTLDHQIGGFSQQQGSGTSITFSSQFGTVQLSSLPVVSRDGKEALQAPPPVASSVTPNSLTANSPAPVSATPQSNEKLPEPPAPRAMEDDIFTSIERLGDLKSKGILTDEEFVTKKKEMLARL